MIPSDLNDFRILSNDQYLRIELKGNSEFIYGTIIRTGKLTYPSDNLQFNNGIWGDFNKINNWNNFKNDPSIEKEVETIHIDITIIDDIEIITI